MWCYVKSQFFHGFQWDPMWSLNRKEAGTTGTSATATELLTPSCKARSPVGGERRTWMSLPAKKSIKSLDWIPGRVWVTCSAMPKICSNLHYKISHISLHTAVHRQSCACYMDWSGLINVPNVLIRRHLIKHHLTIESANVCYTPLYFTISNWYSKYQQMRKSDVRDVRAFGKEKLPWPRRLHELQSPCRQCNANSGHTWAVAESGTVLQHAAAVFRLGISSKCEEKIDKSHQKPTFLAAICGWF